MWHGDLVRELHVPCRGAVRPFIGLISSYVHKHCALSACHATLC